MRNERRFRPGVIGDDDDEGGEGGMCTTRAHYEHVIKSSGIDTRGRVRAFLSHRLSGEGRGRRKGGSMYECTRVCT